MDIRDARPTDAPACCAVLRRSIAELCHADHQGDPAAIKRWLANKTVENITAWINHPSNSVLVAVENASIVAVGSVADTGEIGLNYVSPDARFRGISRALLRALEARAAERGRTRCTLSSTRTARRFYLENNYIETDAADGAHDASSFPMTKQIVD